MNPDQHQFSEQYKLFTLAQVTKLNPYEKNHFVCPLWPVCCKL